MSIESYTGSMNVLEVNHRSSGLESLMDGWLSRCGGCSLLFVLLFPLFGKTQNTSVKDPRWQQVGIIKGSDTASLKRSRQLLQDWFGEVKYSDVSTVLAITDSLGECCRLLGDSAAYYEAIFRNKATIYEPTFQYDKTFDYLWQYAEAMERLGTTNAYVFIDIGNLYFSLGMNNLATKYYSKANSLFVQQENWGGQCTVLDNLSQIKGGQMEYDSAVYYAQRSLAIRRDKMRNRYLTAYAQMSLGFAYSRANRFDEAKKSLQLSITTFADDTFPTSNDFQEMKVGQLYAYRMLADVYLELGITDSASALLDTLEVLVNRYQVDYAMRMVYVTRAKLYVATKQYEKALWNVNMHIDQCIVNSDFWSLYQSYQLKSDIFYSAGKADSAYFYMRKSVKLSDSLSASGDRDKMLLVNNAMLQIENRLTIARQTASLAQKDLVVLRERNTSRYATLAATGLFLIVIVSTLALATIHRRNKRIAEINAALERANDSKELLISIVSHDLRSPFNAIIGLTDQLTSKLRGEGNDDGVRIAQTINTSAKSTFVLLDNLMQWITIDKEHLKVKVEVFTVSKCIDEIHELFRLQAISQGVNLEIANSVQLMNTDRNLIQVVVRNLLSNAFQFATNNGRVILSCYRQSNDVVICVYNDGPEISDEKILEIGAITKPSKVAGRGHGLGLLLVKDILSKLNGTLRVRRVEGAGTEFLVLIHNSFVEAAETSFGSTNYPLVEQFTLSDLEEIRRIKQVIAHLEIFDTTEILTHLKNSERSGSVHVNLWKQQLQDAIREGNTVLFEKLMQVG